MGILFALVASLLPLAPAPSDDGAPPPNVLVIIADDLGVDRVGAYGEHPNPGNTPVLDQLAADGLLFRNAWSNPVCSATRATLLTGRYSFRTGIGLYLQPADDVELTLDENTIPKVLPPEYRKVAVGKWHLSGMAASGAQHPMLMGFEHHHGSLFNLDEGQSYFAWDKNVDGQVETSTTYATTDAVDEALAFISQFSAQPEPEPWFMWLAFNAPHSPYHHPPEQLHSFSLPAAINKPPLFAKAATEAMDTEIGRLLSTMDPAVLANTYVIFLGDNGTQQEASTAPFTGIHAKNTTYEGGVNVPLIVKGPGVVAGAECAALVNTVDLFETVMDIVGVDAGTQDSESMFPYFASPDLPSVRGYVYADMFAP
ncbi:MAG: sulfatase-like hydrolase/transferase, partial [Planctomycetota bacterium]